MVSSVAPSLLLSLLLLLRPVPLVAHSVSLPAAFLEDMAGSGEAEGPSASSASLPPPQTPALRPTSEGRAPTPAGGPPPPTNFLDGIVDFFRQYVMLIAVVGSLAFLLLFVVCAALITRQQRKATAYYPSSFPKKKYVDQSDRAGGPRAFSEVPDRAPDGRPEEALDSSHQLQADILAATQNLRPPPRAAPGGEGTRLAASRSEEEAPGSPEEAREAQEAQEAQAAPEAQAAQAPGVPTEKLEVAGEWSPSEAEGALAACEGPGEPKGSSSLAQEAPGSAGAPESPCACSSVSPSD